MTSENEAIEFAWEPDPHSNGEHPHRIRILISKAPENRYGVSYGDGETELVPVSTSRWHYRQYYEAGIFRLHLYTEQKKPSLLAVPVVIRDTDEPDVGLENKGGNEWQRVVATIPTDVTEQLRLPWRITWIEGQPPETVWLLPGEQLERDLPPGGNTVLFEDLASKRSVTRRVTVEPPYDPYWRFTWRADTDESGQTIGLQLTKTQPKPLDITWGDGTPPERVSEPTPGHTADHRYPREGVYTALAAYTDGTGTPYRDNIRVPWTRQKGDHVANHSSPGTKPRQELDWYPTDTSFDPEAEPLRVVFQLRGYPQGTKGTLHPGDGASVPISGAGTVKYTYEASGVYTAAVRNTAGKEIGSATVLARPTLEPDVTLEPDADGTIFTLTIGEDPNVQFSTRWRIDWGNGNTETHWLPPGGTVTHEYDPGEYTVHIEDVQGRQSTDLPAKVGYPYNPQWAFTYLGDEDETGRTVGVELLHTDAKPVTVNFGGDEQQHDNPQVGDVFQHQFPRNGVYLVSVAYTDGSGEPYHDTIRIPWV